MRAYEERECFFQCPYCWSEISMILDLSAGSQRYIEDCEVCCRPIQISFDAVDNDDAGDVEVAINAERADDDL